MLTDTMKQIVERMIPTHAAHANEAASTPASIHWGDLRRVHPIGRRFGHDRGKSIHRYYIERFLASQKSKIAGHVLEIGDDQYTRKYGRDAVTKSDVLHVTDDNPKATIVADLTRPDGLALDQYDCIILTQTLPHIFDVHAAVRTLARILKPGGMLLATLPGIGQISRYDMDRWGDYWRFTTQSAQQLLGGSFAEADLDIESHGNVLTAVALLHGLAAEELDSYELDHEDPDYQIIITARARRARERA